MKKLAALAATGSLLATLGLSLAFAQQNNNNNNNNNSGGGGGTVGPPPSAAPAPRISMPTRIRSPLFRLTPQQFMAFSDLNSNTTTLTRPQPAPGNFLTPLTTTTTIGAVAPDGEVSFGEFVAALSASNPNVNLPQAAQQFQVLDRDLDGVITLNDFNQAFAVVGT